MVQLLHLANGIAKLSLIFLNIVVLYVKKREAKCVAYNHAKFPA